jgi:hypothetical protein
VRPPATAFFLPASAGSSARDGVFGVNHAPLLLDDVLAVAEKHRVDFSAGAGVCAGDAAAHVADESYQGKTLRHRLAMYLQRVRVLLQRGVPSVARGRGQFCHRDDRIVGLISPRGDRADTEQREEKRKKSAVHGFEVKSRLTRRDYDDATPARFHEPRWTPRITTTATSLGITFESVLTTRRRDAEWTPGSRP